MIGPRKRMRNPPDPLHFTVWEIKEGWGRQEKKGLPNYKVLQQGCHTHFHGGHISLTVAFKGPNVILGLYKCNYSLTVK